MLEHCFISGDSFEEDNLVWSPSTGQLVASRFDMSWQTFAKGGQGNFYILNSIITNIKKKKYSLALINWSSINRSDYITYFSNWGVTAFKPEIKDSHFSVEDHVLFTNLNYILCAQEIFEANKIPYCMWWGLPAFDNNKTIKNSKCKEIIEIIESKNTFFDFYNCSYYYAKKDNLLSTFDNKHPDQEAHRRYSEKIIKFIKEKEILKI